MSIDVTQAGDPLEKKILLLVTRDMFERLAELTRVHNISRNQLMRDLLEYGIDELERRTREADSDQGSDQTGEQDDVDQADPEPVDE